MVFAYALAAVLANAQTDSGTELTVYNQGFALVKDVRTLNLRSGRQDVRIEDVAQLIEPSSVGIRSVSAPGSFEVLEQNYQYDLINTQAILRKAVGQTIVLNRILPNGQKERITGTLMSAPDNGMVIRTDDGRILLNPSGEIEVSSIPSGLISKPSLLWDLVADRAGENKVELSYITQGISWTADYVLSLDKAGVQGDLKGWVTLNNGSGATYTNAKLKLLAGDVARAQPPMAGGRGGGGRDKEMMADAGFQQEQFADYHLYTLQRPATVRQNEMKQVSLLEAFDVKVKKRLIVDAMRAYGGYRPQEEGAVGTGPIKPQIRIDVANTKANQMGMPLPMGRFKVFQRDSSGAVQLLGEDSIDHTPRDETVSLVVGRAFDIVAERKRTFFAWIRRGSDIRGAKETFEIEIRNRKDADETVTVIERHWGEYKILEPSMPFTKPETGTVVWEVPVKGNETKKLVYTVETTW